MLGQKNKNNMRKLILVITVLFCGFACNRQTVDENVNKGNAKDSIGDFKGAIEDYNKAIEVNPDYTNAYYNRGIVKYTLGNTDEACLDWHKASELGLTEAGELIKQYCK